MKYSVEEFAKQIRDLYPGDYDDISDENLTKLWLSKYPKDIEKVDFNNADMVNQSSYFSFKGIIAAIFFGYIAYYIYPFAKTGSIAFNYINDDKISSKVLLNLFNIMSDGKFSEFANFFYKWFWVLFFSFVIKVIISLRHAFISPKDNFYNILLMGVLFDCAPIFIFVWKQKTFDDATPFLLFLIPAAIGMLLLYNTENLKNHN
jgi:hypothetical protein